MAYIKNDNIFNITYNLDYKNKKFAVIQRICEGCGLFSFYKYNLGCIHKFLIEGYIPIIDIKSFPNIINGFNTTQNNIWDFFFEQPFKYTLEGVVRNAKNITYFRIGSCQPMPENIKMPFDDIIINFWHNFAKRYSPVKSELIDLANKFMTKLFKNSKNILGVLARGTDYIANKPSLHPIPPKISDLILDIKKMDQKFIYDYIFFSTEDDKIREILIKTFAFKIKHIQPKFKINYNYKENRYIGYNKNIKGNYEFNKIYLLNIIILSKCLDLIAARCNGIIGVLILSDGFRNKKIYNLGQY